MPLPLRLALLGALGAVLGALANLAIYRWAWSPRSISPWSRPPAGAHPRRGLDRLPVVGWSGLRREASLHGRGFWIRPLAIELFAAVGLAWLYWWEVVEHGLYPAGLRGAFAFSQTTLHLQFASHVVLIALMVIASFIDIDEKIIPDQVTVTGTLAGLLLALIFPWSLLPHLKLLAAAPPFGAPLAAAAGGPLALPPGLQLFEQFLTLASPASWPAWLTGRPQLTSLAIGLGCYWLWCFAILPRPWYPRHGVRRALRVSTARMCRGLRRPLMLALVGIGSLVVVAGWWRGGAGWAGLLTALVGLAGSGGLVWAVRIIGAVALRKEAMGFGDVLLMMMIGTFLGWQPCLVVFFLAPFAGLVIGVLQYLIHRDQSIPYGPFLCLAALLVVVGWASVWDRVEEMFRIPWLVPAVLSVCLVLMGLLLLLMRVVREALFNRGPT